MRKVCIIGDILIDISLKTDKNPIKMRLGGVVHAARALWALNIEYDVAYLAPSYLDTHIEKYLNKIGCNQAIKIGEVKNLPYVMLIGEVKEIGDQQYEFLLRDEKVEIIYSDENIKKLCQYSEVLAISGNYDLSKILNHSDREAYKLFLDIANNVEQIEDLKHIPKCDTLFVSTSSNLFKKHYGYSFEDFAKLFSPYADKLVLKENRGGSRAYDFLTKSLYKIPSQTQGISHSVGVGDVYAAATMTFHEKPTEEALNLASWIAASYASTTFPNDFRSQVLATTKIPPKELLSLGGCLVPWEKREECNIYIAAPDFDYVDTSPVETLCNSLIYHNFVPRRPIKENGQMTENADKRERLSLFNKDIKLLEECKILVAVLLYNDPGTCIEIGLAAQRGIPTIVYDPYSKANNCMLTELPTLVSSDLDLIISAVFIQYSKLLSNGN